MGQGPESVGQAPGQAGANMGRGGSPCLSLEDDHLTQKIYFYVNIFMVKCSHKELMIKAS